MRVPVARRLPLREPRRSRGGRWSRSALLDRRAGAARERGQALVLVRALFRPRRRGAAELLDDRGVACDRVALVAGVPLDVGERELGGDVVWSFGERGLVALFRLR